MLPSYLWGTIVKKHTVTCDSRNTSRGILTAQSHKSKLTTAKTRGGAKAPPTPALSTPATNETKTLTRCSKHVFRRSELSLADYKRFPLMHSISFNSNNNSANRNTKNKGNFNNKNTELHTAFTATFCHLSMNFVLTWCQRSGTPVDPRLRQSCTAAYPCPRSQTPRRAELLSVRGQYE